MYLQIFRVVNISFKKCNTDDLELLTALSKSTFIAAFEAVNNPDDFQAYVASAFHVDTIADELSNQHSSFYFIFKDNTLTGYLKLNEKGAQNEQFDSPSVELERFYISSQFQGEKIGQKALSRILEMTKVEQVAFLWLGVWEENHGAIRFYERLGFKKFGTHPYMLGNDRQTDWLMKYDFS